MINTLATIALGALLAGFAVCAVLANERAHATRRRLKARRPRAAAPASEARGDLVNMYLGDLLHLAENESKVAQDIRLSTVAEDRKQPAVHSDRRLPVGDFLFGALALRGSEPFATADLAAVAADSGLDLSQVLAWLAQAEESGLVERLDGSQEEGTPGQPSVWLTPEGLELARENRRGAFRAARTAP